MKQIIGFLCDARQTNALQQWLLENLAGLPAAPLPLRAIYVH